MGIFSAITGFLGNVADGVVKKIAPGCSWKPSSLISQASGLLPAVVNAIPVVGPLISNAVPAVESIFSGTTTNGTKEEPVVPSFDQVKALVQESIDAIKDTRTALEGRLGTLLEAVERQTRINAFNDFQMKVMPPIEYLKSELETLNKFVPYGVNAQIISYVPSKLEQKETSLLKNWDKLTEAVDQFRTYLSSNDATQELYDLYIFSVVWLLTYDKTILTLRSYVAQYYFGIDDMTSYSDAITAWNNDFKEMVKHADTNATFVLGELPERHEGHGSPEPGDIEKRLEKRLTCIDSDWKKGSDQKWALADSYPKWAIGYIGEGGKDEDGKTSGLITVSENDTNLQAAHTGYKSIQEQYFDTATRAARHMAEKWRTSVYAWQTRLPLSPSPDELNLVAPTAGNVYSMANAKKLKDKDLATRKTPGSGYVTGETVTWCVSYVTAVGEGFMSTWSTPMHITYKDSYVKLELKPVAFPINAFNDSTRFTRQKPNSENLLIEAPIVRRVYVSRTREGNVTIFHVGDVSGMPSETLVLWDTAEHAYPIAVIQPEIAQPTSTSSGTARYSPITVPTRGLELDPLEQADPAVRRILANLSPASIQALSPPEQERFKQLVFKKARSTPEQEELTQLVEKLSNSGSRRDLWSSRGLGLDPAAI